MLNRAGRQILGSSMSRPKKPLSTRRRRPRYLVFADSLLETPGLTSPSISDTSSRVSLETRVSGGYSRPQPPGARPHEGLHQRQKSPAEVKLEATIREEPSSATMRPADWSSMPPLISSNLEPTNVRWDIENSTARAKVRRSWLEWQREASDEYQRIKNEWVDSDESKDAIAGRSYPTEYQDISDTFQVDFNMPTTTRGIADFLAKSSESYKPLDQLPLGRTAHRRKSSLSDIRILTSPYGLPLPQPPQLRKPKTSLITKYERKKSSNSSNSPLDGANPPISAHTPVSALFATFARELPPSPPPSLAILAPLSPFHPTLDAFGLHKQADQPENDEKRESKRARVTSIARRQALGWGRRRYSDEPAKVHAMAREIEGLTVAPTNDDLHFTRSDAVKDKENVPFLS